VPASRRDPAGAVADSCVMISGAVARHRV